MNFLEYFFDLGAFASGSTERIVYSLLNLLLILAPTGTMIYLAYWGMKFYSRAGTSERRVRMQNAVINAVTFLIASYFVYALGRFIVDQYAA